MRAITSGSATRPACPCWTNCAAAARGVRVRLLVDDNGTAGLDGELAMLNALPNFQVRLFNPFTLRRLRWLGYGFDFNRLNRRMHNKSFCVDGAATIIGGRNIGDISRPRRQCAVFRLRSSGHRPDRRGGGRRFRCLLELRSVHVRRCWCARCRCGTFAAAVTAATTGPEADMPDALLKSQLVSALADDRLPFEWVPVSLYSDPPEKGLRYLPTRRLLVADLTHRNLAGVTQSLDIVSAYFIPASAARAGCWCAWQGPGGRCGF